MIDKTDNLEKGNFHIPVMKKEVIKYLISNKIITEHNKEPMYIDATVGGGGHCQAILESITKGIVIGLDWDIEAINFAKQRLSKYHNLYLYHTNYINIDKIVKLFPQYYLQGILFDLGVSSYQISTASRGFSYSLDGPLDMRFNQSIPSKLACEIINHASFSDLTKIFFEYGEEREAKKIAKNIFMQRNKINTTAQLAQLIREVISARYANKTLSRIFQSLRIVVNQELENIKVGVIKAINLLTVGGRIVVISYHSLEDRIIKQTFRDLARQGILTTLTKKTLRPKPNEVQSNPRARSARLRGAERVTL